MANLTPKDRKALIIKHRIEPSIEKAAALERYTDEDARKFLGLEKQNGFVKKGSIAGIGFPGFDLSGAERTLWCVRRDTPDINEKTGEPENKYMGQKGGENRHLYCLPDADKRLDTAEAVVLVEAAKSVLAIESSARRSKKKIVAAATNGCEGWKREGEPLPDLALLAGKDVVICLDSDVGYNPRVQAAEKSLSAALTKIGARSVRVVRLPEPKEGKIGPDDFLIKKTADGAFWKLVQGAKHSWEESGFFATAEALRNAPPPSFLIEGVLTDSGVNGIGGPSGHGKTLIVLSILKALLTGEPLFGYKDFKIKQTVERAIWLTPEIQDGQARLRLEKFGLMRFVDSKRLLVRSLSQGVAPDLNHPVLIAACPGSVVVLDTLIRFSKGAENSAEDINNGVAGACFNLIGLGARTVLAVHHTSKGGAEDNYMDLRNTFRGSSDIGAMLSGALGVRQIDKDANTIHIEDLKPRDHAPLSAFQITGRPNIDAEGDFRVSSPPGATGPLSEYLEKKSNSGRKQDETTTAKISFLAALPADVSHAEATRRLNEHFKTNHKPQQVGTWRKKVPKVKGQ